MIKIEANIEGNKVSVKNEIHFEGRKADVVALYHAVIESLYKSDKEIFTLAVDAFIEGLDND